jgi:hypothetical protein
MVLADLSVKVLFYGLLAFVPDALDKPQKMTVYLVKERTGSSCLHEPFLRFEKPKSGCPSGSYAYGAQQDTCRSDLRGVDVSFSPEPRLHVGDLYGQAHNNHLPLPSDQTTATDFYYVVRMSDIYRHSARIKGVIDWLVDSQVQSFGWLDASSCFLETDENYMSHMFTFVDLAHVVHSKQRQALAKIAEFKLSVPDDGTHFFHVKLATHGGAPLYDFKFLCIAGICPPLSISNGPKNAECGDWSYGMHFANYHGLVEEPKDLIPLMMTSFGTSVPQQNTCRVPPDHKAHSFIDVVILSAAGRPICPMVVLDPP